MVVVIRVAKMWHGWPGEARQILDFGRHYLAWAKAKIKIATENKQASVRISYQIRLVPANVVFRPKDAKKCKKNPIQYR